MLKLKKIQLAVLLFLFIQYFENFNSLVFRFTTQSGFDSAITTIKNYANRQYLDTVEMYGYDYRYVYNINDIRGISIISQCTNLKKFVLQLGKIPNSRSDTLSYVVSKVQNLEHLEYFGFTCHTCTFSSITPINTLFIKLKKMTTFHGYFHVLGMTNFCSGITNLQDAIQLKEFSFSVSYNYVFNTISCFQNKLKYLVNLEKISLNFSYNNIGNIVYLKNEFNTLKKVHTLYINCVNNPVTGFGLQNSFKGMESLKTFSLNAGPTVASNIKWSNFTIVHDTLEEITLVARPYLQTSYEIYKHLPNLKRVNFYIWQEYRYASLKHMTNQLGTLEHIDTIKFIIYNLENTSASALSINGWGTKFNQVSTKIKSFVYSQDYCNRNIDSHNIKNVVNHSTLPNLKNIDIYLSRYNSGTRIYVPQFNHNNVKTVSYRVNSYGSIQSYWSSHQNFFNNLPSLKNVKMEFTSCSLSNSDMANFYYVFYSIRGKTLENLHIGFYNNQISSYSSIKSRYALTIVTELATFDLSNNKFTTTNGIASMLEGSISKDSNGIQLILTNNQVNNVSGLGTGLANFESLQKLKLDFVNNQIVDINQFSGTFQKKYQLKDITFWIRGNPIADQTNLSLVFDDIVYGRKPTIQKLDIDLKHPVNGQNPILKEDMEEEGQYLAIQKYGYCYSSFAMAKRFVLGSNKCLACVNEFCHSCSKPGLCDKCRKSEPQRQLPTCLCNLGFYNGSGSACLQCSRKCESCDNGQDCLTCVNSVPKRIGSDCICPDGYYDDGINDQCGTCKLGSATCSDGMTSNSCIDGYYYLNRQCILCPAEFSKCHYDQESKSVKSLQCIGENRLYIPEMNCPCIEGFYPIKFVSSCFACNPVCTTCTSFKNCTECLPGYYLQLHKDQINKTCKKCSPLCKTCSQQDTCDTCESRQFDPSTGCTQQYVSGNSNYSSQDGSGSQNGGGYTNNGGEYQNGQYINGSGSGSGTTSGSGGYYNGSGSGSGTTSGSGEYQNGSGSSGTTSGSGEYQNGSGSGSGNYGSGDYQNGSGNGSGTQGNSDYQNDNGSGGNYQGTDGSTNQYGGNGQYNNNGTGSESEGTNDIQNAVYQENFKSQFQQESTASFSMFNPTTNMTYQVSCNPECDSCEDQAEKCLTCHIGLNRQNDPPFCGCLQGYYNQVDSYDCLQCNSTCLECRTKNECTQCNDMDFRKLDENRKCSCISGYKEVKGQSQCQVCYQIQEECVLKCPAYTIQDEQQKICQQITYLTYPELFKYVICGIFLILALVIAKIILNKLTFTKFYHQMQNNQVLNQNIEKINHKNKEKISKSDSYSDEEQDIKQLDNKA